MSMQGGREMKKINRFLLDALNRYGKLNVGKTFTTTEILHGLTLRNGGKYTNSVYIKGSTSRMQAISLHYALMKHPNYEIATPRKKHLRNKPHIWRYVE